MIEKAEINKSIAISAATTGKSAAAGKGKTDLDALATLREHNGPGEKTQNHGRMKKLLDSERGRVEAYNYARNLVIRGMML